MVLPIKPISDLRFQMAKKARRARVSKVGSPVRRESVMNSRSREPAPAILLTSESADCVSKTKNSHWVAMRQKENLTRAARLGALSLSAFAPSETFLQVYPRKGNPRLRGESRQQPPSQVVRESEELAVVPRQGVTTDRRGKTAAFWRGGQEVTGKLARPSKGQSWDIRYTVRGG